MTRLWSLLVLAPLAGCGGLELYDVVRTPQVDCEIRPNGEFCGEVGAPLQQKLAVERRETHTLLYFDEETWIAEGIDGERTVEKIDQATRDPGPCTTTLRRVLTFAENGNELSGSLEVSTRIEGPDACGETPRGQRTLYTLSGTRTNSI